MKNSENRKSAIRSISKYQPYHAFNFNAAYLKKIGKLTLILKKYKHGRAMGAPSYSTVHLLYTHKKQKSSVLCQKINKCLQNLKKNVENAPTSKGKGELPSGSAAIARLARRSISSFAQLICGGCLAAPRSGALVQDKQPPKCLL